MTIDLSALPTIGPDVDVTYIPLNQDTFPYADLGAQGRYQSRSTPGNLPELLATLSAQRRSDTHGSLLQVDDDHNLYVNVAAGGGGGGGTSITPGNYVHSFAVQDLDFGGGLTGGVTHFIFDATALAAWTMITFAVDVKIPSLTGDLPSFRLDFSGGSGPAIYWPVALLYPPMPFVANGWTRAVAQVPLNPPADAVEMSLNQADLHARVWGGGLYGGEVEIIIAGLAA